VAWTVPAPTAPISFAAVPATGVGGADGADGGAGEPQTGVPAEAFARLPGRWLRLTKTMIAATMKPTTVDVSAAAAVVATVVAVAVGAGATVATVWTRPVYACHR